MASPPGAAHLLPGDHFNFSFTPSPSSPPLQTRPESTIDPNLFAYSTNPLASTSSHHHHHSHSHSHSPEPSDASMDEDDDHMTASFVSSASKGKRSADAMEDVVDEDHQRRGPPEADTPGGDCKSLCIRHQRMANGGTNLMLQKSIESLPPNDQQAVNTVWSLFSSSPARRRLLILRGLLTIACPSQLSFLQDALTLEMRLDPLDVLPREVSLKVFGYLDAISLGRAAQVSKNWKSVADDDILWRTMCEQHIERKCEKCGWGLPLLGERRRKARAARREKEREREGREPSPEAPRTVSSTGSTIATELWQGATSVSTSTSLVQSMIMDQPAGVSSNSADASAQGSSRPSKRAKTESPAPSRATTPGPGSPRSSSRVTRPWKSVYCERLAIERNWRKGTHSVQVLTGHTDSITCLQVADDLPHPNFSVLMTGSWDRSVRIWNLDTGKEVGVIRGHTRGVRALQFDAVKLVTGSMDSTLKIWNWRTGECMRTLRGHGDAVICLAYDKQLLVSGSADSTIRVWDFGTGEVYALRGHTEWVNSVALWDSNTGFASTSHEGDLGKPSNDPKVAKESNRGKFLFSASDDSTIRVWDLYTRECVRILKGHVAQVQSLRVITADPIDAIPPPPPPAALTSPKPTDANYHQVVPGNGYDDFFATAAGPSCATTAGAPSFVPGAGAGGAPSAAAFQAAAEAPHPDISALPYLNLAGEKKPIVVSASLDNTVKVWDVEAGVCEKTLFGHIEGVWDVAVDKLRIVSGSHDRTLKIWDKESGRNLHTLVGHTSAVTAVVLQDSYVVSGGDDGTARVWSLIYLHQVKWPVNADFNHPESYGYLPGKVLPFNLTTPDGITLGAWQVLPQDIYDEYVAKKGFPTGPLPKKVFDAALKSEKHPTILYCHGNAASRAAPNRVNVGRYMSAQNNNFVIFDYRGFADSSPVSPSEEGLVTDARTAWDWLVKDKGVPSERLAVMAQSLGTGVASSLVSRLAAEGVTPRALILVAPFSSIASLLTSYKLFNHIPILGPFKAFPPILNFFFKAVKTKFDTRSVIRNVKSPILILHALNDPTIHYQQSQFLHQHLLEPHLSTATVYEQQAGGWGVISRFDRKDSGMVIHAEAVRGGHNEIGTSEMTLRLIEEVMGLAGKEGKEK
ncbi:sulfur metabolite repression control protein [Pseudohyphozyma bogoriensis]|nr:sulfur metabolite repression control protein [Pseudohyphozyma bogoriensis]